jgi:membrane-anchored mycosin MYCP
MATVFSTRCHHHRTSWVVAVGIVLGAAAALAPASVAGAAGPCGASEIRPGSLVREVPWHQQWLDPQRVWPFATGAGQTVAVIDTGVDGTHPQLAGRVLSGWDVLRNRPNDNVDCASHGTAVGSLIAAQKSADVGFHGIAPGARILPIRVGDVDPATDPTGPKQPTPGMVATAVSWAASHGATVIEISHAFLTDDPSLRMAVKNALSARIVVVAAVGDQHNPQYLTDPPTYPASYPGVIGVGAVDQDFTRSPNSNVGTYVTVTAPGDNTLAATRVSGHQTWTGTSIAAATVAGIAALVRQAWPGLDPRGVLARITATADPTPGGQLGPSYGHGLADAYRAVTEPVAGVSADPIPGVGPSPANPVAEASARRWHRTTTIALIASGGLAFVLVLLVIGAAVLPKGQRHRWRAARAEVLLDGPEAVEEVDSDQLFAVPKAHGG